VNTRTRQAESGSVGGGDPVPWVAPDQKSPRERDVGIVLDFHKPFHKMPLACAIWTKQPRRVADDSRRNARLMVEIMAEALHEVVVPPFELCAVFPSRTI